MANQRRRGNAGRGSHSGYGSDDGGYSGPGGFSGYGSYSGYGGAGAAAVRLPHSGETSGTVTRTRRMSRKNPTNRGFALLLGAVLLWAGLGYTSGLVRIISLRREMTSVRRQITAVNSRNKELEKAVADMQSPAYVEKVAREELGLVRPSEVKFVVARSVNPADPSAQDVPRHRSPKAGPD